MSNIINVQCETYNHKDICSRKETYMKILDFISNAIVKQPGAGEKRCSFVKITDFDFINSISVNCRYHQNWTDLYHNWKY